MKNLVVFCLIFNLISVNKLTAEVKIKNQILNHLLKAKSKHAAYSEKLYYYKKISDLALKDHWDKETRDSIFYSYLQLARLEKNKKNFWFKKALAFHDEESLKKFSIANKTINQYLAFKNTSPSILINKPKSFNNYNILINGRAFLNDQIQLENTKYLISFYSQKYKTQSFKIAANSITHLRPKKILKDKKKNRPLYTKKNLHKRQSYLNVPDWLSYSLLAIGGIIIANNNLKPKDSKPPATNTEGFK